MTADCSLTTMLLQFVADGFVELKKSPESGMSSASVP